uniref:Immunoglobulin subtype domain-containing protein n=1 Tax=Electrophorus electricus TaxID=8005 RepID=A0AAY5EDL6_ELEEL
MQHRSGDGISFTFYSFIPSLLLLVLTGDSTNEVTAYSGGGVRIKCKYEEEHKTNNKYFCKGESTPCADQIKTGAKHTWVNLTVEDSGTYQCAVDIKRWTDKYKAVKLKVKAGESHAVARSGFECGTLEHAFLIPKDTVTAQPPPPCWCVCVFLRCHAPPLLHSPCHSCLLLSKG